MAASLVANLLLAKVIVVLSLMGRLSSASSFLHLGCFMDDVSNPDLIGPEAAMGVNLSAEECVNGCRVSGYAYCGLQGATNRCLCGKSYGSHGSSNDCDMTCDQLSCGGFGINDIYYTPDISDSTDDLRIFVYLSVSQTFDRARMDCLSRNGDLPPINNIDDINQITTAVRNAGTTQTKVWIGMKRSDQTEAFDWVDPRSPKYESKDSDSLLLWTPEVEQSDCVLLDVASVTLETAPCNAPFSYVCRSLPRQEVIYVPVQSDGGGHSAIALYIVLPLFLLCYGGSCIVYCAYRIHRNCRSKARHSMVFPVPSDLEGQQDKGRRLIGSNTEDIVKVKSSKVTEDVAFKGSLPRSLPPLNGARTSQLDHDLRSGGLTFRGVRLGQGQAGQAPVGSAVEDGRKKEEEEVETVAKEMEERSKSRMQLIEIDEEEKEQEIESKA